MGSLAVTDFCSGRKRPPSKLLRGPKMLDQNDTKTHSPGKDLAGSYGLSVP